jgi:transposase
VSANTKGAPVSTKVWIASGVTDMRKGFNGLNMLAQDALERDPPASRKWLIAASIAAS